MVLGVLVSEIAGLAISVRQTNAAATAEVTLVPEDMSIVSFSSLAVILLLP